MQSSKKDLNEDIANFGIKPKKSFGQNFLVSDEALKSVVDAADVREGDKILEVGPGTGLLTERLLDRGSKVLAVEKDKELFLILNSKFKKEIGEGRLIILNADFLDLDFPSFVEKAGFSVGNYKVVANLPYQITSPFFERIVERGFLPEIVALTLQKEVAEKISSNNKKKNSLGVIIRLCSQNSAIKKIFPPHFFYPQPKVSSALLVVSGLEYPKGIQIKQLRRLVQAGFSEKRKKLINNLRKNFPEYKFSLEKFWQEQGLDENLRAEQIEESEWLSISKSIFEDAK